MPDLKSVIKKSLLSMVWRKLFLIKKNLNHDDHIWFIASEKKPHGYKNFHRRRKKHSISYIICLINSIHNVNFDNKVNKAAVPATDSAFKLVIAIANVPPFRRGEKHKKNLKVMAIPNYIS